MLRRLSVENYALIERLDMELSPNLNIITGETGAGKSILLGALGLVLGNRADTAALKDNSHNCVVEGLFEVGNYGLESFFDANDIDYLPSITIRRIITPTGKSRAYVNDQPVQLTVLKELGVRLIDIHSQHQTLMLGDEGFRMRILDAVADDMPLLQAYGSVFVRLQESESRLRTLTEESERAKRDQEYIEYQYSQLAAMKLRSGELEELENNQKEFANVERIGEALGESLGMLDQEDEGVLSRLKKIETFFLKIKDVYRPAEEIAARIRSAAVELRDVDSLLSDECGRVESNPEQLAKVVERLDAIYSMLQKHRVGSVEELLAIQSDYEAKLNAITSSSQEIAALDTEVASLRREAAEKAAALTASRRKASVGFGKKVEDMLARLGMENAAFECSVTAASSLTPFGADNIAFLFSSSRAFTLQPLERIASGGETSRVMLCIKALVAKSAGMPTVIFDEIDTGVSGRIADVTGRIIAELSEGRQVVNITHLPQVASKGSTHFRVYKDSSDGRTHIKLLTHDERITEVAKMLSGNEVTQAAVEQAKALMADK